MKKLELVERKNTTESAKKAVIQFIESFDFDSYQDLKHVMSKPFNIFFEINGSGTANDKAYFELSKCGFTLTSYDSEVGSNIYDKQWKKMEDVFDSTCTFINFKQLVDSMNDFIEKINKATTEKESEIADFLDLYESWKSYQETGKQAADFDSKNEEI